MLIKQQMEKLGLLISVNNPPVPPKTTININPEIKPLDLEVLKQFLPSHTEGQHGWVGVIKEDLNNHTTYEIDLSVIRLEKLGYIARSNGKDHYDNEIYLYKITNDGLDILLKKENEDDIPF